MEVQHLQNRLSRLIGDGELQVYKDKTAQSNTQVLQMHTPVHRHILYMHIHKHTYLHSMCICCTIHKHTHAQHYSTHTQHTQHTHAHTHNRQTNTHTLHANTLHTNTTHTHTHILVGRLSSWWLPSSGGCTLYK